MRAKMITGRVSPAPTILDQTDSNYGLCNKSFLILITDGLVYDWNGSDHGR